jgi:hypothetical protein
MIMGLRTLSCMADDGNAYGVLYCSTSMQTLPFMFRSGLDADDFVRVHGDVRRLPDAEQHALFDAWQREAPEDVDEQHPQALRASEAEP